MLIVEAHSNKMLHPAVWVGLGLGRGLWIPSFSFKRYIMLFNPINVHTSLRELRERNQRTKSNPRLHSNRKLSKEQERYSNRIMWGYHLLTVSGLKATNRRCNLSLQNIPLLRKHRAHCCMSPDYLQILQPLNVNSVSFRYLYMSIFTKPISCSTQSIRPNVVIRNTFRWTQKGTVEF